MRILLALAKTQKRMVSLAATFHEGCTKLCAGPDMLMLTQEKIKLGGDMVSPTANYQKSKIKIKWPLIRY
jgi:hypothetical protein